MPRLQHWCGKGDWRAPAWSHSIKAGSGPCPEARGCRHLRRGHAGRLLGRPGGAKGLLKRDHPLLPQWRDKPRGSLLRCHRYHHPELLACNAYLPRVHSWGREHPPRLLWCKGCRRARTVPGLIFFALIHQDWVHNANKICVSHARVHIYWISMAIVLGLYMLFVSLNTVSADFLRDVALAVSVRTRDHFNQQELRTKKRSLCFINNKSPAQWASKNYQS